MDGLWGENDVDGFSKAREFLPSTMVPPLHALLGLDLAMDRDATGQCSVYYYFICVLLLYYQYFNDRKIEIQNYLY